MKYECLLCMCEICILGMSTWSMYIHYEYVKYIYVIWIREVCIHDMNTRNRYTWYEYVEYVFCIWIREVGILDKNKWNLYTRYEYVEYVYLIWMCGIRTMDMNMWNMYNWYDFGYMMNVTVWGKYLLSCVRHGQGIEIWYSTCRHVQGMDMNQKCDTVILPFGVCLNDSNHIYMINR